MRVGWRRLSTKSAGVGEKRMWLTGCGCIPYPRLQTAMMRVGRRYRWRVCLYRWQAPNVPQCHSTTAWTAQRAASSDGISCGDGSGGRSSSSGQGWWRPRLPCLHSAQVEPGTRRRSGCMKLLQLIHETVAAGPDGSLYWNTPPRSIANLIAIIIQATSSRIVWAERIGRS